jgi:hypothetical protein
MSEIQEAEARMMSIEQRLLAVEATKTTGASSSEVEQALNSYQQQVLVKLQAIRSKIVEEGDVSAIKKQKDDAIAENALLKKEIEKQNYRIQHLIKALNAAEEKAR